MTNWPNHALQRTAPGVTVAASATAFPPVMQLPRRAELGVVRRLRALSMKPLHNLMCCILALASAGCGRAAETRWSDGRYRVYAIDLDFTATKLGFAYSPGILGLVKPQVVAAGSDAKHVVVERRVPATNATEYYIVTKTPTGEAEGSTAGPFTTEEYNRQKASLRLPDFTWSKRH